MTQSHARWIKWLLSGAAFMAVTTSAGCHMIGASYSSNKPPAPIPVIDPPPVLDRTTLVDDQPPAIAEMLEDASVSPAIRPTEQTAPALNVFGELDGHQFLSRPASEVNFQQHTWADEGTDNDVATDPKGQWIVFSSTRNSSRANLYMQKVDGQAVIQLTSENADDAYPVFSPDGKKIAFCSTRGGNWDIYTMDTDGRHVVQVTNTPAQEIHPTFSPDGTRLAYCAMSKGNQWEIWTVDLSSGERRMVGYGLFPQWSPSREKDQIAFQKARARGSRWFSLWTLDLVDGEARRVTEVTVSNNSAIVSPCWSPDGSHLSFATIVEPAQTNGGKPTGQQDIWTIKADGSDRHRVTDGNGVCASPYWACDNRIFFISNRSGHENIWSARVGPNLSETAAADTRELKN